MIFNIVNMRRKVYWIKGKIGGIMLEMKHICIKYNNHVVYNHAYFCAKDNELTVVVGKSGSGKSTLHELLTFQRTGTYEYYYNDENIAYLNENQQQKFVQTHMGIVNQIPAFINDLKMKDHIALCQSLFHGYDVDELAEQLEIKHTYSLYPQQLSGGEKIRMSILLALIHQPEILVFDEPTASLDKHHTQLIVKLLKDYAHQGHTVIIFTHDALLKKEADVVYQIENCQLTQTIISVPQIIEMKPPILTNSKHYTQYLYKMFEHRKLLKITMIIFVSLSIGLCSFSILYGQSVIQKYADQLEPLNKGGIFYHEYALMDTVPPSIGEELDEVKELSHIKIWPFVIDQNWESHLNENDEYMTLRIYQNGHLENQSKIETSVGAFCVASYNENYDYKINDVKEIDNDEGVYISPDFLYFLKTGQFIEDFVAHEEELERMCQEVNEKTEVEIPINVPVYRMIDNDMDDIYYKTVNVKMKIKGIIETPYSFSMSSINGILDVDVFYPFSVIEQYQKELSKTIPEDAVPFYYNYYQFVVEDGYDFHEVKEDIEALGFKVSSTYDEIYTKVQIVKQLNESIFMISGLIMLVVLMLFFGVKYNQKQDYVDFIHFFTRRGLTVSRSRKMLGIYFLYESLICMILSIVFMFIIAYVFFALLYNEVFIVRPSFFAFCIILSLCIEIGIPMLILRGIRK